METLACAPPSYLDAAGAGNHREKLSLPLFARFRYDFRSIDSSSRPSDVVEVDAWGLEEWRVMQPGQMIRSWRCCSWELTLREFLAMESHKFGKSSPGYMYKDDIFGKCFKCKLFFFFFIHVEIFTHFFYECKDTMRSLVEKSSLHVEKLAHLFQRLCKQFCKRKWLSCRIRLYSILLWTQNNDIKECKRSKKYFLLISTHVTFENNVRLFKIHL